jgi:type II secretory pathway component PulK
MVQALVVLAGLVVLLTTLAADQRVVLEEIQVRVDRRRAELATRAAVQRALSSIASANTSLLTLADDWAVLGNRGTETFDVGGATFRMEIIDAGAFVNVNTATESQLRLLALTDEQVDGLLDWREPGASPRPSGGRNEYYGTLEQPYESASLPLATVGELLLVRGWTPRNLYGIVEEVQTTASVPLDDNGERLPMAGVLVADGGAPNTQATGSARINLNTANLNAAALIQFGINPIIAGRLVAAGPYSTFRELLIAPGVTPDVQQQLLDRATFVPNDRLVGLVNLNTASQAVLETLGLTSDVASALVARQSTGLASLGEMATVPGLDGPVLANVADRVTLGGDTWIVRAIGTSGSTSVAIEAVVGMRNGTPRVLTYQKLPDTGVPAWWNWTAEPQIGATP